LGLNRDQLQAALSRIRMLVLDVDGVMTDGGIFLGADEEIKRFDSRDGAAIKYLVRHGVVVAVISGRESAAVERRCAELGVTEVHQRVLQKMPVFVALLERHQVRPEEAVVMGDDLAELPLMRRAGLGIAVADACPDVRRHADWVTRAAGGHGAVREVAEALLKAKGLWARLLEKYLA